jgi:phosphoglucomutase/phosphomannomutase
MMRRIADAYGVRTVGNLLVGFKWIAQVIDQVGPERFVLGAEESHGYLAGTHCRDKDATVAALLVAELAAQAKSEGKSLHEKLDALYWQYGCHLERMVSRTMPGSEGMKRMRALMARLRTDPPKSLAGEPVAEVRDFLNQAVILPSGKTRPLEGPRDDLVIFQLARAGNYVAVRPSGTEPKVKCYLFAYEPPEMIANLEDTKAELAARLSRLEDDLTAVAMA